MTKKYFETLAEALASVEPSRLMPNAHKAWRMSVLAVADACEKHSPRFHRDKFLMATGAYERFAK